MGFALPIKQAVATIIGFYDDPLPWVAADAREPKLIYRNPSAGYVLELPSTWEQLPGPIVETTEWVLKTARGGRLVGRLRPSCDLQDEPMPMTVEAMLHNATRWQRHCGRWHGLEACLLESRGADHGSRWEWLGRDPTTGVQVRLMFELYDESAATADVLAIINSVRLAPETFAASPCPNPIEWAEPF